MTTHTPGQVQPKYLINSDNFKPGYVTPNDSWENRMRLPGQNTLIGWSSTLQGRGEGAKSMGQELAYSEAFAQCQVEKVFRTVCFRSPADGADRSKRDQIVAAFKGNGYTHEAEEVVRCLRADETESPLLPLDESLAVKETLDLIRRSWGRTV